MRMCAPVLARLRRCVQARGCVHLRANACVCAFSGTCMRGFTLRIHMRHIHTGVCEYANGRKGTLGNNDLRAEDEREEHVGEQVVHLSRANMNARTCWQRADAQVHERTNRQMDELTNDRTDGRTGE